MKYVIKNCPNYYYDKDWECPHRCNLTYGDWACVNDNYGFNCPLKQIVEKCRETIKIAESYKSEKVSYMQAMVDICNGLLNLAEIEEVNE